MSSFFYPYLNFHLNFQFSLVREYNFSQLFPHLGSECFCWRKVLPCFMVIIIAPLMGSSVILSYCHSPSQGCTLMRVWLTTFHGCGHRLDSLFALRFVLNCTFNSQVLQFLVTLCGSAISSNTFSQVSILQLMCAYHIC